VNEQRGTRVASRGMRRLLVLLPLGLVLAACGGGSKHAATTTAPSPAASVGDGARTLYQGGKWSVVVDGAKATVLHLRGNRWVADRSGGVKVEILGPKPGATVDPIPQVAAQITSQTDLVESALWVDGKEVLEKGGGSPTRGTIYGAPETKLKPGRHVAVAYGRTATTGTAVGWRFTVR
jgi:hypothetical protein